MVVRGLSLGGNGTSVSEFHRLEGVRARGAGVVGIEDSGTMYEDAGRNGLDGDAGVSSSLKLTEGCVEAIEARGPIL